MYSLLRQEAVLPMAQKSTIPTPRQAARMRSAAILHPAPNWMTALPDGAVNLFVEQLKPTYT